jgi:hypothetical protein
MRTPRTGLTLCLLTGLVGCGGTQGVGPSTAAEQDAHAIIQRAITALGGPAKLERWKAGKMTCKARGTSLGLAVDEGHVSASGALQTVI